MLTQLLDSPAVANADHSNGHGSAPLQAIQDVSKPGAIHFSCTEINAHLFTDIPVVADADHAHGSGPQAIGEFEGTAYSSEFSPNRCLLVR